MESSPLASSIPVGYHEKELLHTRHSYDGSKVNPAVTIPVKALDTEGAAVSCCGALSRSPVGYGGTYCPEGLEKTPGPYAIVKANKIKADNCGWFVMCATVPVILGIYWSFPAVELKNSGIQIVNIGDNSDIEFAHN